MRRRIRIEPRDRQYFMVFMIIFTIVSSTIAYRALNPSPGEQFFAMWILDPQGRMEHYYPNENSNMSVGERVSWTLVVYNHIGIVQYVVLRVKLANSTLSGPDTLSGEPNIAPNLFEFSRVLLNNETWLIPFAWEISNITTSGQSSVITGLVLENSTLTGEFARATSGLRFRFVFELWYYDEQLNGLLFSNGVGGPQPVWTQIWFNATAT